VLSNERKRIIKTNETAKRTDIALCLPEHSQGLHFARRFHRVADFTAVFFLFFSRPISLRADCHFDPIFRIPFSPVDFLSSVRIVSTMPPISTAGNQFHGSRAHRFFERSNFIFNWDREERFVMNLDRKKRNGVADFRAARIMSCELVEGLIREMLISHSSLKVFR